VVRYPAVSVAGTPSVTEGDVTAGEASGAVPSSFVESFVKPPQPVVKARTATGPERLAIHRFVM
jgi:hypothetical protein